MSRQLALALFLTAVTPPVLAADAPSVGFPAAVEVWLPGPELAAVPVDDRRAPLTLRVDRATPERDGYRYTLVYTGLEPGRFDLRGLLRRADGRPAEGLPPVPVEVEGLRPPGEIRVHEAAAGPAVRVGGYRTALVALGAAWAAGLLGLVAYAARRRRQVRPVAPPVPVTFADRLRPLVEAAVAGTATPAQHAELERLLLAHWVRRLGLAGRAPAVVIDRLCRHAEAGPLVGRLAEWLHAPPVPGRAADVAGLLAPYRVLPADPREVAPA
jgi:hypothetical protein